MSNRQANAKRKEEERRELQRQLMVAQSAAHWSQAGLAPYVYALQLLTEWLKTHPDGTVVDVVEVMARLAIWDVRLAGDPSTYVAAAPWWPGAP